jgi:uncharacterized protein (DUF1778 family)
MMKNPENDYTPSRGRRKRSRDRDDLTDKIVFTRFNAAEFDTIEKASGIERRSRSSFVADAALTKAAEILRVYSRAISEREK